MNFLGTKSGKVKSTLMSSPSKKIKSLIQTKEKISATGDENSMKNPYFTRKT